MLALSKTKGMAYGIIPCQRYSNIRGLCGAFHEYSRLAKLENQSSVVGLLSLDARLRKVRGCSNDVSITSLITMHTGAYASSMEGMCPVLLLQLSSSWPC